MGMMEDTRQLAIGTGRQIWGIIEDRAIAPEELASQTGIDIGILRLLQANGDDLRVTLDVLMKLATALDIKMHIRGNSIRIENA